MNVLQEHKTCPLCQNVGFHESIKVKDYSISAEKFKIDVCERCGLHFTNPYPPIEKIGVYYKSEIYISHSNKGNTLINRLYKFTRKITLKNKIKLLNKFPGKNLLDIGCGTGLFIEESLKAGYNVIGVETDENARNNQSTSIRGRVVNSIGNINPEQKFEIITLWHVLEHIHNLNKNFNNIVNHLAPKGKIIIAVPNLNSWDSKHYNIHWAALDVPRHLYHFTEEQIKLLFEMNGITLHKIHPMKFDAYYVSMLSEKYKGSSLVFQLIKGFINGMISNFKAGTKNYSSLIYIGSKE